MQAGAAGIVDPVFEIAVRMETSAWPALADWPAPVSQSQPCGQPLISKGVKWLLFLGGKIIKRDGYRIGSLFVCLFVFYQTVFYHPFLYEKIYPSPKC